MLQCAVCGCTEFYKASGYSFCSTCQTQNEDAGEELELELPMESNTRLRRTKIRYVKHNKIDEEVGWTSWELYNFVLIGLTNELIELGVSADIKLTVLQLWARYLGKLEIAFISTNKKLVPKLARRYKKRDADIIYGKVLSQKRVKKQRKLESNVTDSAISTYLSEETSLKELNRNKKLMITADYDRFMQSQMSSEGDTLSTFNQSVYSMQSSTHTQHTRQSSVNERIKFNSTAKKETRKIKDMAKKIPRHKRKNYKQKHITTQYKTGPELITPMKLWAILYLALRIHDQNIHLGDMLRYGREGHLSYYKLDRLIPPEITLTKTDVNFLSRAAEITHKGMRRIVGRMAKFLGVTKLICPDFLPLINRYCNELNLPRGISLYTERLIALSPPEMKFDKKSCIPNYEARAMAFIIVILKTLLNLDGITEYEISNVADKINSAINDEGISDTKLFSFREWQKYIECRKAVLANAHYPTKLKYSPHIPDVNGLYVKFLETIESKIDREEPEITTYKHLIPRELVNAMKQCMTNINYANLPIDEVNEFPPSLTAHHSYLQQLLEHPLYDLPSILRNDFFSTKIGYMTKLEFICKLISHYNIQLNFIDSNLHFIEKTVPLFEQTKMASIQDLKNNTEIQDFLENDIEKKENIIDYLHKKMSCHLKIDLRKRYYYDNIRNAVIKDDPLVSSNEFIFNETLPNGKLSIPDINDENMEEEDDDENDTCLKNVVPEETALLLSKFCKEYDINLSTIEKKAIFKDLRNKTQKKQLFRNAHGKFVKQSDIDNSNKDSCTEESESISKETFEIKNILPNISDILNVNTNASIFDDLMKNETGYDAFNQLENNCKESVIDDTIFTLDEIFNDNILRLFRPFKDYWMYHCNFSRVKPKNFELFEKMLPRSFRWLLNECASIIEMSVEDLYEEVCLVEAYYAHFSEQSDASNENAENNNKAYINAILKKW
ncbi:LOW QUALITY PROTEIN: TATA box-binding protein-associated factor RNA polymerase I subunit B [Nylanderia fulva]|uniref:LOW QUALITY PROTEIN: TATA box-binding protein-associated factor RNA polymerase I subunit B n=1 Tax=Nylanderia fulva TaxID=613905 RepID=UPI0010FB3C4D|nr:LOW QUALITY PROTEIN: TATA box-binding protein-associated factor RNA polymerase I subunit B [Nylanderia fulva]